MQRAVVRTPDSSPGGPEFKFCSHYKLNLDNGNPSFKCSFELREVDFGLFVWSTFPEFPLVVDTLFMSKALRFLLYPKPNHLKPLAFTAAHIYIAYLSSHNCSCPWTPPLHGRQRMFIYMIADQWLFSFNWLLTHLNHKQGHHPGGGGGGGYSHIFPI